MSHERGQQFLTELSRIHHDLPFSPALMTRLYRQIGDDRTSLGAIADTIARDQALTAKLLAVANSAFYGLQAQVTTVSRAIAVLGLHEIRTIVTALAVQALTRRFRPHPTFDIDDYWRHQLLTATAARRLAGSAGTADPENMFTSGLLHDLGKLLTAMHAPEDWAAIVRLAADRSLPYAEAEEMHWGIEHGVLGAMVLDRWNLPAELTEPINWHHAHALAPDFAPEAELLGLADGVAHAFDSPDGFPVSSLPDLDSELIRYDIKWEEMSSTLDRAQQDGAIGHFVRSLG